MEPDDQGEPVARDLLRLQPDLDLERLVVHLDQPAPEVISVARSDQVGGGILLLHAGKREQSFALGLAELDAGVSRLRELNRLDLVVGDERAGGERGPEGHAVLVDAR